jgi:acetyl-CoA carboxylase biotin carboxyl carrier protein
MTLSDEDVREILRIIDESGLDELRIEMRGFALHVLRGGLPGDTTDLPPLQTRGGQSVVSPDALAEPGRASDGALVATPVAAADASGEDGMVAIAAPMLGTFYRAEGPGEEPFVDVGSRVEPDTTVGIIEVMKMMNSVAAGVAGTIVEVCSENAELVEPGTPLFRVEPEAHTA